MKPEHLNNYLQDLLLSFMAPNKVKSYSQLINKLDDQIRIFDKKHNTAYNNILNTSSINSALISKIVNDGLIPSNTNNLVYFSIALTNSDNYQNMIFGNNEYVVKYALNVVNRLLENPKIMLNKVIATNAPLATFQAYFLNYILNQIDQDSLISLVHKALEDVNFSSHCLKVIDNHPSNDFILFKQDLLNSKFDGKNYITWNKIIFKFPIGLLNGSKTLTKNTNI